MVYAPITSGSLALDIDASPFRVLITRHARRLRLENHDHADPSINIVLHGGFEERIGRRTIHNRQGTLVVKPAGVRHANHYATRPTLSLLIQVSVQDLPKLGRLARVFGEIRELHAQSLTDMARRVAHRVVDPADRDDAVDVLWNLLHQIAGERARAPEPPHEWIARVRDELASGALGHIRLTALASAAGVDPSTLSNAFRRAYGCTAREFVRRQRVAWATDSLRDLQRSISAIAADAGFADHAHFTRAFKRETGLTPAQYRRFTKS